ncbi:MAG TPA: DUF1592 domain-containing protein, partial [Polyangia bacterium]
ACGGSRAGVSPDGSAGGGAGRAGASGDGGLTKGDSGSTETGATIDDGGSGGGGQGGAGGGSTTDAGPGGAGASAVGGSTVAACQADVSTRVPSAPLRRLSNFAYVNTVHDVLGSPAAASVFPSGGPAGDDVGTLTALVDGYHRVAHDVALAASDGTLSLDRFGKCDTATLGDGTCSANFIAAFIPRMFRRPLDGDDAKAFAEVFAKGRELGGDYASGIRAVVEVAMQSPEFLYQVEFGTAVDARRPGLGRPGPYEMAARLSYLLWASAPDDALTAAAAADQLKTSQQIESQARRLLADPHAHGVTRDFYSRLFRLDDIVPNGAGVDPSAIIKMGAEETARFVDDAIWVEGGDLTTVLGGSFSFVNQNLAQVYGISGVTGVDFQRAALPATQRRGVLTQLSLLASRSPMVSMLTHPSQRGALIFEQLLCGDLSQTPSGDQHMPAGDRATGETARQWLQRATAPAACQSCHEAIDPLGLAFEHYASSGEWRDGDGGLVIDARGMLTGVDTAGTFDGALELIDRLAKSRDVRRCHVGKWMESAYGRPTVAADACSRAQLEEGFERTGGNIRELVIGLTQTEAFLYRPAP